MGLRPKWGSAPNPGSSLVGPHRPTPLPRGRAGARRPLGLRPKPRLVACGAPSPHAASSRARRCAPPTGGSAPNPGSSLVGPHRPTPLPRGRAGARRPLGLRPKPRLVACGAPSAPRRFLAGAQVRAAHWGSAPNPGSASSVGATPRTPRGRYAGAPPPCSSHPPFRRSDWGSGAGSWNAGRRRLAPSGRRCPPALP